MRPNARRPWFWGALALLAAATLAIAARGSRHAPLPTVERVELPRYAGLWYEIARLPSRFQDKCASDTTARYSLRDDGRVTVVNTCVKADGSETRIEGVARVVDPATNAMLRVSFFWPFWGDYWVLQLDPEYRHALVGTPSRSYLWILSRTPRLDEDTVRQLLATAQELGFDTSRIIRTRHERPEQPASGP